MPKSKKQNLKITQVKSLIGQKSNHKKTAEALGLKKIRHTVMKEDNPQIRGMVKKIRHMVVVEEVS
jgi:large subunit ribosomal protein L30